MWEQLERYRNHFLQYEVKDTLTSGSINNQQGKEWAKALEKRDLCKCFPNRDTASSTYFEDRAKLAYGMFALPKLLKEMDSDVRLTHWRAIVSLSEFLLNPLNVETAITKYELVRKLKNAFMRLRLKHHKEEYREGEMYLKIYNILSRSLNGAEDIGNRKCLLVEFYKIIKNKETVKDELSSEILSNLTGKTKVLGIILEDPDNFSALGNIFNEDPCRPHYPVHLWHHLCHLLEVAPERGLELGFFELMHLRIVNRLPDYRDNATKAFALLLRCAEGQKRFDNVDGVKLLHDIFATMDGKPRKLLPLQNWEYLVLALVNGLHSKKALWRSREFTMLPCYVGRIMETTETNPRLQLHCLKALRLLGMMPCIKRYIIGNWLGDICRLLCLDAEAECARDALVDWLRRDIADSS